MDGLNLQAGCFTNADLSTLSLEDLLKIKIATNKDQALEDAPSIVSVITKKEMTAYALAQRLNYKIYF